MLNRGDLQTVQNISLFQRCIVGASLLLLILLNISITGCLMHDNPEQSPINITPITTKSDPSGQSGIHIIKSADSICVADKLVFSLVNKGNSSIKFGRGDPFLIQFYINDTWGDIYRGGGTQTFWVLMPGKNRNWTFPSAQLSEFYNDPDNPRDFIMRPGAYRIIFLGVNEQTREIANISTEFKISDC